MISCALQVSGSLIDDLRFQLLKMTAFLRKNLTRLLSNPNSNNVCKFPVNFSLYFNNFSTSSESEADINHKIRNILVHEHNFDHEFVSRVAPTLSHLRKPEHACLVLSFLKESGFSDFRLQKIVNYKPKLLSASLEKGIKPKLGFFQDMGLSSDDISKMISSHPSILSMSVKDNIIPSVGSLERLLGSNDAVARVVRKAPRILTVNFENNVLPKVDFFKSFGVPLERIRIILINSPTCFLLKLEVLKKSAEVAKEMGIDASSKSFIYAVVTIASMSDGGWKSKLQGMRSLGFSDSDILIMFRKAPMVFNVSMEKMKMMIELLLDTNKYTMSSIVEYPQSLHFSIEKRYMPRLNILGILECRNLIQDWPSLSKLGQLSDKGFCKEYIIPYSEALIDVSSTEKYIGEGKRWNLSIYVEVPR